MTARDKPLLASMNRYLLALLGALGIAIVALLINFLFGWRAGKAFEHVQLGFSEKEAMAYMGPPSVTEKCGEWLWWDNKVQGENRGQCVRWARYNYLLSTMAIGYSSDGHVVSKKFGEP